MKTRKLLFATDFSTKSDEALEYAATLAHRDDAVLLIAHVQEPPVVYGEGAFYYGVPEPDVEAVRKMLLKVKPRNAAVKVEHRLLEGDPVEALVDLAEQEQVDCIVLSSHGRTGLMRLLMGSVAEKIVRRATRPVVVIKPGQLAEAERREPAGSKP